MTNEERKYLLEETKRAQASGFEGSVLDVFRNPNVLQDFQAQSVLQPTQGSNIQIASTPEEQQQGLSGVPANQMPDAMVFPNVKPNTSFNTQRMRAPIDMEFYDNQGHLVKSYENVPPGITNLPMGPQGGTVIETPSKRESGGIMQPKGDPWEYKYEDGNYLTRKRGSENWLTAKGTALEAIKSKVYKQPVTTQPQSESTQPSPRQDERRQPAPAPTKPKAKVETPQALDRNFPETGSEGFELIPGLNIGPERSQPAPQEPAAPAGRRSLPRFDIGVRPNVAQADNTRTATPELRGPSLNPPKFDELGRPIELRQEEARRAQQRPGQVTPASPNYRPKIEQPKVEDTEPSWTESAGAWVDEKLSGAQRLVGRVLPADEESLIEIPTENIIIPKVESKDLPIQETYTELGRYPDRGGRELSSFAHTFDNIEGGTYRIGPKVKELYDERGNLREGSQTSISGVAVAHFLRDSDISENQQFAPPSWEVGSSDYEMRNASTEGKLIGYTEAQMKDPERYRMMYRKNENGTYSVKYKQLKNIGEGDAEWAYDLPVSRQHRFSDIDWDKKGKSTGYQALGGRTYYIPLKANAQNISSEGKLDHTSIPVGDPTEFSRFSGGSIVLLFKDPKTGREIGVDVSGSKDALRDTGKKLIKQYGLKEEDVTVAYHDMGSYSAKPAAKDGKLDYNQWYDYNQYNRGMSGAPLVIANQQSGGIKKYRLGGVKKYQSAGPKNKPFDLRVSPYITEQESTGTRTPVFRNREGIEAEQMNKVFKIKSEGKENRPNPIEIYSKPVGYRNTEGFVHMLPTAEISTLSDKAYNALSEPEKQVYDAYRDRQILPYELAYNPNPASRTNPFVGAVRKKDSLHWEDALRMVRDSGVETMSNVPIEGEDSEDYNYQKDYFRAHADTHKNTIYVPPVPKSSWSASREWTDDPSAEYIRMVAAELAHLNLRNQLNSEDSFGQRSLTNFRDFMHGPGRTYKVLNSKYNKLQSQTDESRLEREAIEGGYPDETNYTTPKDLEYQTHFSPTGAEARQFYNYNFTGRFRPVNRQGGGLPGEFLYRSTSAGAPLAYNSPTANGYLLPDPNRPELMNTGATEYKMGVDDVTIPTVVNGNYMDPETAYQRYKLTGEKFKPTADPSAYSKFYDEVNKLGLMKYKKGGKKAKYKPTKMY